MSKSRLRVPGRRRLQRLFHEEAAGGVIMLLAFAVALIWANVMPAVYAELWEQHLLVGVPDVLLLDLTFREWINEALMALFFFHVSLEVRREVKLGSLRHPQTALMPISGAFGGMLLPAIIFLAFNAGTPAGQGWAVPMTTDTALAIGVITLLGSRLPSEAKAFLLTLAVVDDIGAILIIALFYTAELGVGWLAIAGILVFVTVGSVRVGVRSPLINLICGVICWIALHESGVHPTLTGVAFGLATPVWSQRDPRRLDAEADQLLESIHPTQSLTDESYETAQEVLSDLERLTTESSSPLDRVQRAVHPWVTYGVLPVFALANGGIAISGLEIANAVTTRLGLGIVTGLVAGKTLGILGACWLVAVLGAGRLPAQLTFRHLAVISATAGIGFTLAMLIADLAFMGPDLFRAKTAVFIASIMAAVLAAGLAVTQSGLTTGTWERRVECDE